MATGYEDAVDSILSTLKAQWDTDTPAIVGTMLPASLVYEETEHDLKPHPRDTEKPWGRVVVRHAPGGSGAAALGNHRFRRTGTVFLQVFYPLTGGKSLEKASALARVGQKAYESARSGPVSYKSVTVSEKGPDGSFYRVDCTAKFWWDELR